MYNTSKVEILKKEFKKKKLLRHNEYYDTQDIFDNLYKQSLQGCKFKNLYKLIISDRNILLAYRNIKRNSGSTTPGTNNKTIKYWENKGTEDFIKYIRNRLQNFIPQKVKRVEIPKSNGKKRPLGIPNIEDRIIQQCFKQILEPILEAKFHNYSYGFRPNRGTSHAIAHVYRRINIEKNYFIVNVDIKSFFDEVNHSKLLKQLWSLGIRDKKVISIISKMLKAEVDGIGIPTKGIPQGGILSPLLANVVLNEFDHWISNQWSTYETKHKYEHISDKYVQLRNSNLKEMYLVRYADDFLIFCKKKESAEKTFHAIKNWLNKRLKLSINEEKSQIVDIRKKSINYLGFKIKAFKKSNKWIVKSHISDKASENIITDIKNQVKYITKNRNAYTVYILNRLIAGLHNYYQIATEVNKDFGIIDFKLLKFIK